MPQSNPMAAPYPMPHRTFEGSDDFDDEYDPDDPTVETKLECGCVMPLKSDWQNHIELHREINRKLKKIEELKVEIFKLRKEIKELA